jgi:dephospho-CoA kinase
MAQLEAVLHPHIKNMVEGAAHSCGGRCVINAAVLFPMGLDSLTDLVIIVRAPFFTRYRRARSRDDLGMMAFLARCRSQRKIVPKFKPGNVDIQVIWNTRNLTYLKTQVDALMLRYAPAQTKDAPP